MTDNTTRKKVMIATPVPSRQVSGGLRKKKVLVATPIPPSIQKLSARATGHVSIGSHKKRVFVAMSGGVDSSVAAALLKQEGYDITGCFIKGWYPDWLACNWREERRDAMRVCAELGIPFKTVDLGEEYKRDVADYMIGEYKSGRTPNPDVMCNKHIKFGAFLKYALQNGADYIATGHHASIDRRPTTDDPQHKKSSVVGCRLSVGTDSAKDQSYFLWTLTQGVLAKILFPVGDYTKDEVRALAGRFGLHNADKKDSQGICFLGHVDMAEFLKHYVDTEPGKVLNEKGERIGTHDGAMLYTIGQRHGFEVTRKSPDSGPFYVVAKDVEANTITVSEHFKEPGVFEATGVVLEDINWIGDAPKESDEYQCRFRYRQALQRCRVEAAQNNAEQTLKYADTFYPRISAALSSAPIRVCFAEPQKAIAVGQSLVLYNRDKCLGGGVISNVFKNEKYFV